MPFGDAFRSAWQSATDLGRAAAGKVADGSRWVGQKSADAAAYASEKALAAKDWAAQKVSDAADWATERGRTAQRSVIDKGYDAAGRHAEANRVKALNKKKNDQFSPDKKAGSPVQPCPTADKSHDGWMMAPQGPGKPCAMIPPSADATGQARAAAKTSTSECCQAKRAAGATPRDIIYVNGIQTDTAAHCATLNAIATQTCGRVVGVYNATEGTTSKKGFWGDAMQTSQDRRLIKAATAGDPPLIGDGRNPAVDTLEKQLTNELRAGRQPEVWAHSQGGAVTSLALYGVRNQQAIETGNPDPLAGMKVVSMGSAAPVWPDGPAYEHLVHVNDFTPANLGLGFDPSGDAAAAGRGAKVVRFSGDPRGEPFAIDQRLDKLPATTSNHGVEDTYLKMEKQLHGGCP